MPDRRPEPALPDLLLGEWACLGVLAEGPAHGYAVARRLAPDGDLGRVWTLSRPMAYRCLARLAELGLAEAVAGVDDPRASGGRPRTPLAATTAGRAALGAWLDAPAAHLRDVRSVLLVKLLVAARLGHDTAPLRAAQRTMAEAQQARWAAAAAGSGSDDPVVLWRLESATALLRFLDHLTPAR